MSPTKVTKSPFRRILEATVRGRGIQLTSLEVVHMNLGIRLDSDAEQKGKENV